jgi:hypothetical protein
MPARSPERQRLADAIERHAEATTQAERVAQVQRRMHDEFFSRRLPDQQAAEEALAEAREREPRRLVDAVLGVTADPTLATVAEAEAALAVAQQAVGDARRASPLLDEEARRAEFDVSEAARRLGQAFDEVVRSDESRSAQLGELNRLIDRALDVARGLRTGGLTALGGRKHGLVLRIEEEPAPLGTAVLFKPDPAWLSALAALRRDPDAALPGLPDPEPPDAGDTGTAQAA